MGRPWARKSTELSGTEKLQATEPPVPLTVSVTAPVLFVLRQETAEEVHRWMEFRRVLLRSRSTSVNDTVPLSVRLPAVMLVSSVTAPLVLAVITGRSEERRVGKECSWRWKPP